MEGIDDEEELLSLSLSIVSSDSSCTRKRKRKRREENSEGKIFDLLQVREQMLRQEHKKSIAVVDDGDDKGVHLIHLLLISATSAEENNLDMAMENLMEIYQNVSLNGDSVQRVAAYFADGLVAKLITKKSPFFSTIVKGPTPEEEFMAFTELYRVSPCYQFAHFTANQAILEAFEEDDENNNDNNNNNTQSLHIVDFDVSYGFQWPSLIQSLSEKSNRISLKITGFGSSLEQLQETEARLASFAKGFRNLAFEFQGLLRGTNLNNKPSLIPRKKNETVAVNLVFFNTSTNSMSKISETLNFVHSLNPSIVTLVEQLNSLNSQSFLPRFMESLHYFAAMFDSLDDCLPVDSRERLRIEKNCLGKEIKNSMSEVMMMVKENNNWKGNMERRGFSRMKLSSKSLLQAKLLLKIRTHYCSPIIHVAGAENNNNNNNNNGGFRIFEGDEGRAISLGWQDRSLITASAWQCV